MIWAINIGKWIAYIFYWFMEQKKFSRWKHCTADEPNENILVGDWVYGNCCMSKNYICSPSSGALW